MHSTSYKENEPWFWEYQTTFYRSLVLNGTDDNAKTALKEISVNPT